MKVSAAALMAVVVCGPAQQLVVEALDNGLARTPPMGWNSWRVFFSSSPFAIAKSVSSFSNASCPLVSFFGSGTHLQAAAGDEVSRCAQRGRAFTARHASPPACVARGRNHFGGGVSAVLLEKTADQFVSLGLKDAGYVYVNSDDGWLENARTADGDIVPAPGFGQNISDLQALAASIHSRGLKFGLYNAAGLTTCMSRMGGLYVGRLSEDSRACTH